MIKIWTILPPQTGFEPFILLTLLQTDEIRAQHKS